MYAQPDPARHMLAWLNAPGWDAAIAAARPEHAPALARWRAQDWPLVVRRTDADAAEGVVCLGLPLPPDAHTGAKVRIPLRAQAAAHVARYSPAVELRTALRSAGAWDEWLAVLHADAEGLDLRVFGSLAMQSLTGLPYLSPSSDVDVLLHPSSRSQLEAGVAALARHAGRLPLDGEIVFPGGQAVAWKEWQMAMTHPAKVMVKELRSVRLSDTAALLATLEQS